MKKTIYLYTILCVSLFVISCGGSKDDGDTTPVTPEEAKAPEASVLVFPLKDEICTTGVFISDTESEVEFEWNTSENTTSYDVILKDLNTDNETTIASNSVKVKITLKQNNPYSWKVISKSDKTEETATSDEWRLYNASQGVQNYAPFPAKLLAPSNESTIATTSTNLEWQGLDVDGTEDIETYEVYLEAQNSPTTLLNSTTDAKISTGDLTAGTYYWNVVTIDKSGNKTTSQVNSFIVN